MCVLSDEESLGFHVFWLWGRLKAWGHSDAIYVVDESNTWSHTLRGEWEKSKMSATRNRIGSEEKENVKYIYTLKKGRKKEPKKGKQGHGHFVSATFQSHDFIQKDSVCQLCAAYTFFITSTYTHKNTLPDPCTEYSGVLQRGGICSRSLQKESLFCAVFCLLCACVWGCLVCCSLCFVILFQLH